MKISEIKDKELRELADLRRKEGKMSYSDELLEAFEWDDTNSRWKEELDLQLKYSAYERKEKRKLIAMLKI